MKALFHHILARFSKLNNFTINSFPKEVAVVTFFSPELTFSKNSANSAFLFSFYSSERKRTIRGNF